MSESENAWFSPALEGGLMLRPTSVMCSIGRVESGRGQMVLLLE